MTKKALKVFVFLIGLTGFLLAWYWYDWRIVVCLLLIFASHLFAKH